MSQVERAEGSDDGRRQGHRESRVAAQQGRQEETEQDHKAHHDARQRPNTLPTGEDHHCDHEHSAEQQERLGPLEVPEAVAELRRCEWVANEDNLVAGVELRLVEVCGEDREACRVTVVGDRSDPLAVSQRSRRLDTRALLDHDRLDGAVDGLERSAARVELRTLAPGPPDCHQIASPITAMAPTEMKAATITGPSSQRRSGSSRSISSSRWT